MGLKKEIAKYKAQSVCVKIIRKSKMPIIHGYILGCSDDLIIVQEVDDFIVLGYIIIPKKSIKSIRYNACDKTYDNILKAEKQFEKVHLKYEIDLTNWKTTFQSVKSTGLNLTIECEKRELFLIGILGNIKKENVYIRYFDATGILDDMDTLVFYKEITKINFDDRYVNTFSKYLKTAN